MYNISLYQCTHHVCRHNRQIVSVALPTDSALLFQPPPQTASSAHWAQYAPDVSADTQVRLFAASPLYVSCCFVAHRVSRRKRTLTCLMKSCKRQVFYMCPWPTSHTCPDVLQIELSSNVVLSRKSIAKLEELKDAQPHAFADEVLFMRVRPPLCVCV